VFHCSCHNLLLPIVMNMPCQSVINMLLMTSKYVMECKMFQLKMFNLLSRRLLLGWRKMGKVDKNWAKVYKDELHPWKKKIPIKIWFTSKFFLFKETLEFKGTINLCYSRQTIILHSRFPILQTWSMAQKKSKVLILVVT
jgi:hypothetical protein